ncbi:MAG: ISAs1 family transposase, partial [Gammaproteobacteria bacterium]
MKFLFPGKTLCGARRENGTQVHLLSALLQSSGATLAQHEVPEIKALLKPLDLQGRVITADAMH